KDPVAPVLDAIASTTIIEVPSIVETTPIIAPALATEAAVELTPAEPKSSVSRPPFRARVRNFANGVIADIKSFFTF
ncbi:MAG TPA: hypothetical protein VF696_01810, partial [Candidatus Paceibacterota bacterium]